MLFNTIDYIVFFVIAVIVYFILPKKVRYIWLLLASYYFYMNWNAKYALLLFASTAVTYCSGLLIRRYRIKKKKAKCIVAVSFILNIGMLVLFKYTPFLIENLNALLGMAGRQPVDFVWKYVLPVGISFYVFQALSYTVDVYRGEIEPERNFLKYALFVSFFPQLVAGPIERSKNLLRQIQDIPKNSCLNFKRMTNGLIVILWGLFIKMVIADRIAIFVNVVFANYYHHGMVILVLGAIGFAIQIYCDFAGYSIIAIGSAQVLGFTLMENFDTPYFAMSIHDFWRRWHVSLSTWFRDYLYIPLGGNRCSRKRKWLNQFITMTVSGLWHGANWTYVTWGALHGVYQIAGDASSKALGKLKTKMHMKTNAFSFKLGKVLFTFALVDFAWIFFRADSVTHALLYIKQMFSSHGLWALFDGTIYTLGLDQAEMLILWFSLLVLGIVSIIQYKKKIRIDTMLEGECIWFRWVCIAGLFTAVWVWGIYGPHFDGSQFIYFQF